MAPADPTVAASTTQAPFHFINDTKLYALEEAISELTFNVTKVGKSFEVNGALGNTIELTHLVDTIKEVLLATPFTFSLTNPLIAFLCICRIAQW